MTKRVGKCPYNPNIPTQMPPQIAALKVDSRGYPIPWFVRWVDGEPDFIVMDPQRIVDAVKHKLCWVCGQRLYLDSAFVIGPMCAVNRISAEPPSHRECGEFSAVACPFLVNPLKKRPGVIPSDAAKPPESMILRNPGVVLVWLTATYKIIKDPNGRWLFEIGDPMWTRWYKEGRTATRAEVMESVDSGLPILRGQAEKEGYGAVDELDRMVKVAQEFYPK